MQTAERPAGGDQVKTTTKRFGDADVTPGTHGVGGWDVSVWDTEEDRYIEVTLLPSSDGGEPTAWGDPDHWIDGVTLAGWRDLPADEYRERLEMLESAASRAIKDSGIEPAEDVHERMDRIAREYDGAADW